MWLPVFACCCEPQKENLVDDELPGASEEPSLVKNVEPEAQDDWFWNFTQDREGEGIHDRRASEVQRYRCDGNGLPTRTEADWQHSTEAHFAINYELLDLSSLTHQEVVPWYYYITRRCSWRGSYTQTVIPFSSVEDEAMSPIQVLSDRVQSPVIQTVESAAAGRERGMF